jgi:sortase A
MITNSKVSLKTINKLILVLIILLDGYVVLAPFIPGIIYDLDSHTHREQQLNNEIKNSHSKSSNSSSVATQPNHVVIPSMLLDQPLLEGPVSQTYQILAKGVWRYPLGSTPNKGGNTVLIGHRFTYTNPEGVFYFMNKVNLGDTIAIFWDNHLYTYSVSQIMVVPPSDTAIENQTKQAEVTLFTCTPLALPNSRLVIVAKLDVS